MNDSNKQLILDLLKHIFSGAVSAIVVVSVAIASTAIVFRGALVPYLPIGMSCAFIAVIITNIISSFASNYNFSITVCDLTSSVILSIMVSGITNSLLKNNDSAAILPTVLAAIVITTLIVAITLYLLGKFRLGNLARFIPYPVLCGFLAGTGWFIFRGAYNIATGEVLSFQNILTISSVKHFLPAFVIGMIIFFMLHKYKNYLIIPLLIIVFTLFVYIVLIVSGVSHTQAIAQGWFYHYPDSKLVWQVVNYNTLTMVQWGIILKNIGYSFVMTMVVLLTLLLNASALELRFKSNCDFDHELKITGQANIISGLALGFVSFLTFSYTILNKAAGANRRWGSIVTALLALIVLLLGTKVLRFLPIIIISAILVYIAAFMLYEWVIKAMSKMGKLDYANVLVIMLTMINVGILQGVALGLIISFVRFVIAYSRLGTIKRMVSGKIERSNSVRNSVQELVLEKYGGQINIIHLQGYLFFGTAHDLLVAVQQTLAEGTVKYVVLDFKLVTNIDTSAVISLTRLFDIVSKAKVYLILVDVNSRIKEQLVVGKLIFTETGYCRSLPEVDSALEWCEDHLLARVQAYDYNEFADEHTVDEFFDSEEEQQFFYKYCTKRHYDADCYLCRQGDVSDCFYILDQGDCEVILPNIGPLHRIGKSNIVGEFGFFEDNLRSADVRTLSDCVIYTMNKDQWHELENDNEVLAKQFLMRVNNMIAYRHLRPILPNARQQAIFKNYAEWIYLAENEILFRQGDPATAMYIILSGQLKVLLEFENGEPIRLGSMRAGTTIGEMAFTTSLPRTATVVATEETVLYELTLENFRKLNKDHPDLALKLLEGINAVITTRLTHMNRSVQILTAS